MSDTTRIDRREFVKWLGGGILVVVNLPMKSVLSPHEEAQRRQRGYPEDINAYLHIATDGSVTLYSGKIEMGQGIMTSLTQEAAEELGVALDAIRIVMGDTDTCPWDRGTFGSLTTRMFGPAVRAAAAQARLVLTDGELARGQKITHTMNEQAVLRAVEEFTVMGRSPTRLDGYKKVTGEAKYAGDIRRPGMLYARILRPPTHGASLTRVETAAARALPGVTVVNEDGLVAVLAADPETAERALALLEAEFDVPAPKVNTETIFDHLVRVAPAPDTPEQKGDLAAGRRRSATTFEATYYNSYVAHAPMEPHTAVAEIAQAPFSQQETIARALGFQPEAVRVITPYVGGGFGGKVPGQQAVEAARLAKITGKPVQVCWTRAEEFFYDTFRPAAVIKVTSGIDAAGRVVLWDYQVYGAGSRGSDVFYDIANRSVRVYGEWRAHRTGCTRSRWARGARRPPTPTASRPSSRSTRWPPLREWTRWRSD
jgi:isoquinoline 1-oxidoreductase